MSSISFHSPSEEIRISGRERASMGGLCNRILRAQLGLETALPDLDWLQYVTAPGHYLHTDAVRLSSRPADAFDRIELTRRLMSSLQTYLNVGHDGALILDGKPVDEFELNLNSAIEWGNRAIQLAAKLHGQCEIHAYIEGEDRAWLAEVIEEAIDRHVFRPDGFGYDGWPRLVEFLRASSAEPVVTSYSVCDSFPNPTVAPPDVELDEDDPWETWSSFSDEQQWQWGMDYLRARPGMRICAATLDTLFGDGITGRIFIDRALAIASEAKTKEAA